MPRIKPVVSLDDTPRGARDVPRPPRAVPEFRKILKVEVSIEWTPYIAFKVSKRVAVQINRSDN